jgi:1-acyl-sn-glycerol-3-phosphate acyltransferase
MSYVITGLLRLCHIVFGLYAWIIFFVCSLATIVLVAIAPLKSLRRRVAKATSRLVFWLIGTPLAVSGMENIPGGASILVANHSSYMDGLLLTAVLPASFSFVIKGEMTRVPLVTKRPPTLGGCCSWHATASHWHSSPRGLL